MSNNILDDIDFPSPLWRGQMYQINERDLNDFLNRMGELVKLVTEGSIGRPPIKKEDIGKMTSHGYLSPMLLTKPSSNEERVMDEVKKIKIGHRNLSEDSFLKLYLNAKEEAKMLPNELELSSDALKLYACIVTVKSMQSEVARKVKVEDLPSGLISGVVKEVEKVGLRKTFFHPKKVGIDHFVSGLEQVSRELKIMNETPRFKEIGAVMERYVGFLKSESKVNEQSL